MSRVKSYSNLLPITLNRYMYNTEKLFPALDYYNHRFHQNYSGIPGYEISWRIKTEINGN